MKRKVEIFTAGCPVCDPVVKMVKDLACDNCEIITYDTVQQCDNKECLSKIKDYDIQKLPAVAVDGKLLACCQGNAVSQEALVDAGIGQV